MAKLDIIDRDDKYSLSSRRKEDITSRNDNSYTKNISKEESYRIQVLRARLAYEALVNAKLKGEG
ncbi:hypothetical protein Brsp01_31790 [Brucella sp. NBRC 12950]|nr:hypothetical protein Brsp01_31790 [Brucella sp. NBRC 12950]